MANWPKLIEKVYNMITLQEIRKSIIINNQKHDTVMCRCGLNDFADSLDTANLDGYIDLESEIEELENEILRLTEEMEELKEEENI